MWKGWFFSMKVRSIRRWPETVAGAPEANGWSIRSRPDCGRPARWWRRSGWTVFVAPMIVNGPINGESFADYVESSLVGELAPGDIVVMDNLPVHKSRRVADAIEGAGCVLVFLPPYSPDLSPIENMWSKVKAIPRKAAARTFDAVVDATGDALRAITPEDCDGYFGHCGYDALPN